MLLETFITELIELNFSNKNLYYENLGKNLNNKLLQAKTYWSVLKSFYTDKKLPLILPLLVKEMVCN